MSQFDVHLICGTEAEVVRLVPIARAMRAAGLVRPVLLGSEPADLRRGSGDLGADLIVAPGPLAEMLREFDTLWAGRRPPRAVLVAGDSTASLAAALAAAWRDLPVVHLGAARRSDDLASSTRNDAFGRLITQVAALHLAPTALAAMNLLDEGIAASDILIAGDTVFDAALAIARRHLPPTHVVHANPYSDGHAADRAAQATAALLGLADRPAPMPIPAFDEVPATIAAFGV